MEIAANIEKPQAWKKLKIAIVGGDDREQEIARLAGESGAEVRAFGFPWPESGIANVRLAGSAAEALEHADIALMPIPGIATDGSIFATEKTIPDRELLSGMASGAHIILGTADGNLREASDALNITLHEYESDQELMLLRAPAIVEAAIKIIIENTRITIHQSPVCVVGLGNIGRVLARTLVALGADVTVAARNPVQRAYAYTLGAHAINLDELAGQAGGFPIILSTVPAPIVTREIIDRLPANALVMDLSAPPGGVDLGHVEASGRSAIWARALGRRAPVTVGASQWSGIVKIINGIVGG